MSIFSNNNINWNFTASNKEKENPFITATMTESQIQNPNDFKYQDDPFMQSEEAICVSQLKNKRMAEQQKSKRRAYINNLRKKICEETLAHEEESIAYQIIEQSQIQSQLVHSQISQQGEQLKSFDDAQNIVYNEYSAGNPDEQGQSLPLDFIANVAKNGTINDCFMNNNSFPGQFGIGEGGITIINQTKTTCSPSDIIRLIQFVYNGGQKLPVKDSRQLKLELSLLRKNLISINNNMGSSTSSGYAEIPAASMNIMDGGENIGDQQQQQQNLENQRKKQKEAQLFGNDINQMVQVFQGMIYIVQNQNLFRMDVVYECIWTLSNYSSTENMRQQILEIYESNAETFLNFINNSICLVDQQQASFLVTKVILILGNLCLESFNFCQRILMYQDEQLLKNIQKTILYLPNPSLIAETIWLLGIFYKTTKHFYKNDLISKNIAHILNRFKTHPRVIQELLWYLIQLSGDGDNHFHNQYFDETVLIRILTILIISTHNGNSIACLTLLSNALSMLPYEKVEFITSLVTTYDPSQFQNGSDIIITKQNNSNFNQNQKNALQMALNKCISSNIIEIQRESFVFLSNLVVLFPLYVAQRPELINSLITIFSNGQEELFVDLCYIFSNLIIQLPQSPLLAQQHPQLINLMQAILSNDNIQQKYSPQLNFIFQHFANFLHQTKF